MATLWDKLTGRTGLIRRLDVLQGGFTDLATANALLQQQLAINFRAQGGFTKFDFNNQSNYIINGYNISSAVYAITSDIAQKAASIPLKVYEVIDDKALAKYKGFLDTERTPENIYYSERWHTKALAQVDSSNPLQQLIDCPNSDDDPAVFWQEVALFRLICGNSFMYAPSPDKGYDMGKVTELRIMPSPYTALIIVQGFPARIIGYEVIMNGVQMLKATEVIHLKYPNLQYTIDGQQLYGFPPLKAAFKTLQRSNSAETSATAMFDAGGPAVIVANKSLGSDDISLAQGSKIQKKWNDEYAGNTNRGKFKLMGGDIGVFPLSFSPVDLNILESEKWSFDMLCNVFKVSSIMFNNHSASTESNVKEMRKDSWTRAVLPERKAQADALNRKVVPGYNLKNKKYFIDMDTSNIPELQADMQTMATWLNTSWWIPPNEKRLAMDFDESADENMNKIWMPSGYQLMDDMVINVDNLPNLQDAQNTV